MSCPQGLVYCPGDGPYLIPALSPTHSRLHPLVSPAPLLAPPPALSPNPLQAPPSIELRPTPGFALLNPSALQDPVPALSPCSRLRPPEPHPTLGSAPSLRAWPCGSAS